LKVTFNNETGAIVCDPWYTGIMMERIAGKATQESVMRVLSGFRFGVRTDVARKVMNNRDAAAVLFWHLGPMKSREMIALLRAWRGKCVHLRNGDFDLSFTYLFNTSRNGGYGCVAQHIMQRGWKMSGEGWSGIVSHRQAEAKKTFFRRTYWYRVKVGTYAPTTECAKRVFELGLQ